MQSRRELCSLDVIGSLKINFTLKTPSGPTARNLQEKPCKWPIKKRHPLAEWLDRWTILRRLQWTDWKGLFGKRRLTIGSCQKWDSYRDLLWAAFLGSLLIWLRPIELDHHPDFKTDHSELDQERNRWSQCILKDYSTLTHDPVSWWQTQPNK